jgi:hypothetical protein
MARLIRMALAQNETIAQAASVVDKAEIDHRNRTRRLNGWHGDSV